MGGGRTGLYGKKGKAQKVGEEKAFLILIGVGTLGLGAGFFLVWPKIAKKNPAKTFRQKFLT